MNFIVDVGSVATGIAVTATIINYFILKRAQELEGTITKLAREIARGCQLIWEIKENGTKTDCIKPE